MKIYLAAKFERRLIIREQADKLWRLDYEIVSTWLNEVQKPSGMLVTEFNKKLAIKDLAEIKSADILILDTAVASERGGKEVEFGFALGQFHSKRIFIVGPKRNVFHELCDMQFEDWDACLVYMEELANGNQR